MSKILTNLPHCRQPHYTPVKVGESQTLESEEKVYPQILAGHWAGEEKLYVFIAYEKLHPKADLLFLSAWFELLLLLWSHKKIWFSRSIATLALLLCTRRQFFSRLVYHSLFAQRKKFGALQSKQRQSFSLRREGPEMGGMPLNAQKRPVYLGLFA